MGNLLKADFFRILKSKLTWITLGLSVGLGVFLVMIYFGIGKLMFMELADDMMIAQDELGYSITDARTLISSVYSFSNNAGIIIPIFSGLLVGLDISNGSLRNKIISGQSRIRVYFSHLITSMVFNVVMITVFAGVTAAISVPLFGYGREFGTEEINNLCRFIVTGTAAFLFMACVSTALALSTKSIAPTIIFTVLIGMGLYLITSIIALLSFDKFDAWINFLPAYTLASFLQGGIAAVPFLEGLASFIVLSVGITAGGIAVFRNQDIR